MTFSDNDKALLKKILEESSDEQLYDLFGDILYSVKATLKEVAPPVQEGPYVFRSNFPDPA